MKMLRKDVITDKLIFAVLVILGLIQLFPLIWLIDYSLNKSGDLFVSGILKWPDPPQWQNYVHAFINGKVLLYLKNSLIVNTAALAGTILLSVTLGYAFTRMRWKLRKFVMTVMLLGMMIPIHATLLPNFKIFQMLKITDSYFGLILPYIGFSLPVGIFLMTGFLSTVPTALEESAVMDGYGVYGIIFKIIFPITVPATITVTIMTFLNNWNEFIMAYTYLSKDSLRTLPFSVINFAGPYAYDYAVQFAVMALAAFPALLVYFVLNERITKGITVGAVKG